jgi:hypothetical protein
MSRLRRALIVERSLAKEQAKQWLYGDAIAEGLPADLAVWRATCFQDAVNEHNLDPSAVHLLRAWEAAFDATIFNLVDRADQTITRAVFAEDKWMEAGFDSPACLLAKCGDVVIVQPSPFASHPFTITPRTGPVFCGKASWLLDVSKSFLISEIEEKKVDAAGTMTKGGGRA